MKLFIDQLLIAVNVELYKAFFCFSIWEYIIEKDGLVHSFHDKIVLSKVLKFELYYYF